MRFFIEGIERPLHDAQEEIAMLRHRILSLNFWQQKMDRPELHYFFRDRDRPRVYLLLEFSSEVQLDRLLKADPLFPYLDYTCQPVLSTRDLIEEVQDFFSFEHFNSKDLAKFEPEPVLVDQCANYVLVYKHQPPFSPLLSETVQEEIYKKTATSQEAHDSEIEISDVNPVGSSVGIHVSRVLDIEEAKRPVESTAIFPDTVVSYHSLLTVNQALAQCEERLTRLGHPPKRLLDV